MGLKNFIIDFKNHKIVNMAMTLEIAKDATGSRKRVYWEHPVFTTQPLVELQKAIACDIPSFKPSLLDDLHLTLFHYGKPQSLHQELVDNGQSLNLDEFMKYFIRILVKNSHFKKSNISVAVEGLDIFGDENKPVVVVRLIPPHDLLKLRRRLLVNFCEFLDGCGVKDVEKFMMGSENLKYQTQSSYKPHFTLGSLQTIQQVPDINCQGTSILIGPPQLANVIS